MKKIFIIIPILISIYLLLSGHQMIIDWIAVHSDGMTTIGTVVSSEHDYMADAIYTVIVYEDSFGQEFEYQTGAPYNVGQQLKIMYQRSNPANAFVADSQRHLVEMITVILLGLFLFVNVFKKLRKDDFDEDDDD